MKWAKWAVAVGVLASVGAVWLVLRDPVNGKLQRVVLLFGVLAILAGLLFLVWRVRTMRFGLIAAILIGCGFLILPGRAINPDELRTDYVRRMADFEGTDYFWGGESRGGIDCSGLPRRAYRDALLSYGVRHLNGKATRGFVEHWWFDTSARSLGEGYRDFTVPLGVTGTIAELDAGNLQPGDLAVTVGGLHVLAYAGDGNWIQADPAIGRVATQHGKRDKNNWFKKPVTLHRWSVLDND